MSMIENPGGKRKPWLKIVVCLLGLILLVEAICMALVWKSSDSAAARMGEITHAAPGNWIRGVSLSKSEPIVDGEFLDKIAALHQTGIDSVRVSLDFMGHAHGGIIDGAWMGQAAEMMEMIYQNNYRVIVSVAPSEANKTTQLAYINLWNQIDAAWGHRPVNELIYELRVPEGAESREWIESAQMIVFNICAKNGNRKILLTFTPDVWAKEKDAIVALAREYAIYVGLIADAGMDTDLLDDVQKQGIEASRIVLAEPDQGAADAASPIESIEQLAEQTQTGYLLRGN